MKTKKKKILTALLAGLMLAGLVSCGSDDNDDDTPTTSTPPQQEESDGTFVATLTPANPAVDGDVSGTATVTVSGDNLNVNVQMSNGPTGMHMQHIHTGSACATMSNDSNADGYLDANEASAVAGKILIPLDGDLDSQGGGSGTYPSGSSYSYSESGSLAQMLTDLWLPDTNTSDSIVKLPTNTKLNLPNLVVEIHGVPSGTTLPNTVGTIDGLPNHETLPIACGVLTRSGTTTGGTTGTTTGGTTGTTTGGTTGTTTAGTI